MPLQIAVVARPCGQKIPTKDRRGKENEGVVPNSLFAGNLWHLLANLEGEVWGRNDVELWLLVEEGRRRVFYGLNGRDGPD